MSGMDRLTEMLPCPFCGSVVRLGCDDYSIKASQKYYIECQGIDCLMQDMEDPDCDLLVAAWNRRASQAAPDLSETCTRCMGNGEIVTDWDAYLHPPKDATEEAVADCPDCDGTGHVVSAPALSDGLREAVEAMPETDDRQLWDDAEPDGYLESNRDWARRNDAAVEWLADNHVAIRAALTPAPAQEGGE